MTASLHRRQVLQGCAAATLLAATGEPLLARAQPSVAFFFDPRHASSQALAARLNAAQLPWGTAIAPIAPISLGSAQPGDLEGLRAARALPAGTQRMAGRTSYADFTWLAGLASERRLRARFHAYHTLAAAGTVERRVLIEEGAPASRLQRLSLVDCDLWLEQLLPEGAALPCVRLTDADRAGCTLHDWIFQAA